MPRQTEGWTEGRREGRREAWKDEQKDGQTLFHRTLPAIAGGPKTRM